MLEALLQPVTAQISWRMAEEVKSGRSIWSLKMSTMAHLLVTESFGWHRALTAIAHRYYLLS